MKHLKYFVVNELGEANVEPYEIINTFKKDMPGGADSDNFVFQTESGLYYDINIIYNYNTNYFDIDSIEEVRFIDDSDDFFKNCIGVSFITFNGNPDDLFTSYDDTTIVNRGEIFRVMSTIIQTVDQYIKDNPHIKYIFLGGAGDERDKNKREKLYLNYIRRLKPHWEIENIFCGFRNDYYHVVKIN